VIIGDDLHADRCDTLDIDRPFRSLQIRLTGHPHLLGRVVNPVS
jgi:hypothetical protein